MIGLTCRLGRASAMTQHNRRCTFRCWAFASLDPTYEIDALRIYREASGQGDRLGLHLRFDLCVACFAVRRQAVEHLGHQAADMLELGDAEATRGPGGRADANARGDLRLLGIE